MEGNYKYNRKDSKEIRKELDISLFPAYSIIITYFGEK